MNFLENFLKNDKNHEVNVARIHAVTVLTLSENVT